MTGWSRDNVIMIQMYYVLKEICKWSRIRNEYENTNIIVTLHWGLEFKVLTIHGSWDIVIIIFYYTWQSSIPIRGSRPEVFCKEGVFRNFIKFTGKHLCQRLFFNKVAGLKPGTLLKKSLWPRCFPANIAKFLRTPLFTEYLWWLLLKHIVSKVFIFWVTRADPLHCYGHWKHFFMKHFFQVTLEPHKLSSSKKDIILRSDERKFFSRKTWKTSSGFA